MSDAPETSAEPCRVVFLSASSMLPTTSGGNQRTELLARSLQQLGELQSILLRANADDVAEHRDAMCERYGLQTVVPPPTRGRSKRTRQLAHNLFGAADQYRPGKEAVEALRKVVSDFKPHVIVSRQLRPAMHAAIARVANEIGARTVIDIDDLDWRVYESRLEHGSDGFAARLILNRHLGQLRRHLPGWLGRHDHIWVASDADLPLVDHRSVSVLPNIPWVDPAEPDASSLEFSPDQSPVLLLVASMNHGPNVRGVRRFLTDVWPTVYRNVPAATLRLVGSHMSAEFKSEASEVGGVEAVGFVDNLTEEYRRAFATVSPVYEGGGTKIKVLESLRFGRPVVATRHSAYGYEDTLASQGCLLVAEQDGELAQHCTQLLTDPSLCARLGREGRELVEAHYSYTSFAARVRDDISTLTRQSPRTPSP